MAVIFRDERISEVLPWSLSSRELVEPTGQGRTYDDSDVMKPDVL
jgi:hypothetical protein